MKLAKKKCVPCESGKVKPLSKTAALKMIRQVEGWAYDAKAQKISKNFLFKDFKKAMKFVNAVAKIAEQEGHHPNIAVFYNRVSLELWTHAIGGLSENDFILADKINELPV